MFLQKYRTDLLGYAQQEIERIGRIVHQLLNLYRPGAALPGPVQLNTLLERIFLLLGKRICDQLVRLITDLAADLPVLWFRADELIQMLLNLIVNALDAMPDGSELQIRTTGGDPAGEIPDDISIVIRNTGSGIEPAIQADIFDEFFTTKKHGTGLGLSISRQIVQQYAGSITVESRLDHGSTFTVTFPRMSSREEDAYAPPHSGC